MSRGMGGGEVEEVIDEASSSSSIMSAGARATIYVLALLLATAALGRVVLLQVMVLMANAAHGRRHN